MFYIYDSEIGFVECPSAKPVQLEEFKNFAFFVHRSYEGNKTFSDELWSVSEAATGGGITIYHRTRKEAIKTAQRNLSMVTKLDFVKLCKKAVQKYGLSPYTKEK